MASPCGYQALLPTARWFQGPLHKAPAIPLHPDHSLALGVPFSSHAVVGPQPHLVSAANSGVSATCDTLQGTGGEEPAWPCSTWPSPTTFPSSSFPVQADPAWGSRSCASVNIEQNSAQCQPLFYCHLRGGIKQWGSGPPLIPRRLQNFWTRNGHSGWGSGDRYAFFWCKDKAQAH